jgi:hypothetical protein
VTQAVAESDRRETLADLMRPVMDNQLSDPSHNELTTMAPVMAMMVELQKEIGELRRSRDRNISSDTDDSEAEPGSTPMVDIHLALTPEELALRTYKGFFWTCAVRTS